MSALEPERISVREFARRDGCDDALVRRAIKRGKLTPFDDGTLDASLVGSGWRQGNRRGADRGADRPQVSALSDGGVRAAEDIDELDDGVIDDFIERALAGKFVSHAEAERIKENGLALRQLLDAKRKAGALVDAELARQVLFEGARAARDAWLAWPSRVGPLIAAQLDVPVEPLIEALTAHVHQQLADLGEPEADFGEPDGSGG